MIFLLVFFFWIALELVAVSLFAARFGALGVFVEVILSFVLGIKLLSSQPGSLMQKLQREMAAGHDPKNFLFGRLRVFFAGFLLLLPGLITDAVALILLLMNLFSSDRSKATASPWTADRTANEQDKDFEDAWDGDEFTKRMRKHQSDPDQTDVVDAQIISTEDRNEDQNSKK